ncbi:MAG TPA: hypothetical protein VKZ53_04215 [Candidatus Angelobacter sp.]|nr:hypothetical protein [Candidatus Angelobacter sp.]
MKPSKDKQQEPFSDDPTLVMKNLVRLVRACQAAPQDRESRKAAIGVVLGQIQEERRQREKENQSSEPGIVGGPIGTESNNLELDWQSTSSNLQTSSPNSVQEIGPGADAATGARDDLGKLMRELLDGKSPIESWYERPSTDRPPGVMLSPGAHNMICVSGGYSPFQGVSFEAEEFKYLAPDILKTAQFLNESEQRKARELVKNLENAAQDAGNGTVMLAVVPLSIWAHTIPTSGAKHSKS